MRFRVKRASQFRGCKAWKWNLRQKHDFFPRQCTSAIEVKGFFQKRFKMKENPQPTQVLWSLHSAIVALEIIWLQFTRIVNCISTDLHFAGSKDSSLKVQLAAGHLVVRRVQLKTELIWKKQSPWAQGDFCGVPGRTSPVLPNGLFQKPTGA